MNSNTSLNAKGNLPNSNSIKELAQSSRAELFGGKLAHAQYKQAQRLRRMLGPKMRIG